MPKGKVKQIDINSASVEELSNLKALDKKKVQALVDYRDKNGAFESWDDLEDVPGFSSKLVQDIKQSGATLGAVESEGEEEEW
ncbi:MAG: helix-hairpin-helix domain-containing protein [Nitrospiraceae bacterium]|nr:helix-hairpin-helix domain-containing protein [Nitrospiraceae bacterium]